VLAHRGKDGRPSPSCVHGVSAIGVPGAAVFPAVDRDGDRLVQARFPPSGISRAGGETFAAMVRTHRSLGASLLDQILFVARVSIVPTIVLSISVHGASSSSR